MFLSGLIQQQRQSPRSTVVQDCQQKINSKSAARPVKTAVIPRTKLMLDDFYANTLTMVYDLRKIKALACN